MRRGEVLGLTWQAIDLDGGTLSIRRTLVTTQARRAGDPGMSWSEPKTDKGWRTIALDLHDLRQSYATLALKAGIHPRVVQERLGHANVGITLRSQTCGLAVEVGFERSLCGFHRCPSLPAKHRFCRSEAQWRSDGHRP